MSGWNQIHRFGSALYDFNPSGDFQIPLKVGDRVEVYEESSGWYKGIVLTEPPQKGIFPASFVEILPEAAAPPEVPQPAPTPVVVGSGEDIPFYKNKLQRLKHTNAGPSTTATSANGVSPRLSPRPSPRPVAAATTATEQVGSTPSVDTSPAAEPAAQPTAATSGANGAAVVVEEKKVSGHAPISHSISLEALYGEISSCILEWSASLELHIHGGNILEYHKVKERMSALLELRSKVMAEQDARRREALRDEIIHLIESSRKMQEGYMVPRNKEGEMADTNNTGVLELLSLHRQMYSTLKEESSAVWRGATLRRRQSSVAAQNIDTPAPEKRSPFPPGLMQLFLDIKMTIVAVGEPTELYFNLFCEEKKGFISEPFTAVVTETGMPEDLSLLGKVFTLFKDLDSNDFDGGLHLVCYIYRRGRLQYDGTKKRDPSVNYRRPFGCAVLGLSTLGLETMMTKEYTPPQLIIYCPLQPDALEEKFHLMHQMIIAKDLATLQVAPKTKGVALSVTLFHGDEAAVRAAHAKLKPEDVPVTNKLDFPEVMKAGDQRNDLYLFLVSGRFNQDTKTSAKNVEISLRICNSRGDVIPDCIIRGSGKAVKPQTEYSSTVYYHNNEPVFNECLRLRIDPVILESCHVYVTFSHISTTQKKGNTPFSFGFLPLTTPSGAVIADQEHTILSYAPGKDDKNDAFYLRGESKLLPRKNESLTVRSKLCSTKKTQNEVLHSLFKWSAQDTNSLKVILSKFLNIKGSGIAELSKFVREIFDVFFGILVSPHHIPAHELVFQSILHLLGLLTDKKIQQYRPMVDSYISDIFRQPTVHHMLVSLSKKLLSNSQANPDAVLMQFSKCFNYVIKLIVASRQLDMKSPNPSCDATTFKTNFREMLNLVNALVKVDEVKEQRFMFLSQSYFVRGFPDIVDELKLLFDPAELGAVARDLIAAIPNVETQTLNKLNLVRLILSGEIGEQKDARLCIFPIVMSTLKTFLRAIDSGSLNEPYVCIAILQKLLSIQQSKKHMNEQSIWDFHPLLPDLVHVVLLTQEAQDGQRQLKPPSETVLQYCKVDLLPDSTTALWSLMYALRGDLMEKYVKSLDIEEFKVFSTSILSLSHNCLALKLYPEMWIVMNMLQISVIAGTLKTLGEPIRSKLGPNSPNFIYQIWKKFFELSLGLLSIEALKVEKFSNSKREFVLSRYGDIRKEVILELRTMWSFLGKKQIAFTGVLVASLFDLAQNSVNEEAKTLSLDMYYDMVSTEFLETNEFSEVERSTIDALYNIANISQEAGDKFMELFYSTMKQRLSEDPKLADRGVNFLKHVAKMYELMSSLLKFPDTAIYEDERTSVALKLMNYLEESGHVRKEMASRYVQYLVDLHMGLGNFVEAGMAQLSQLKMLDWKEDVVESSAGVPAEPERERKERIFKSTISSFVQGETYERAVLLCEQLRQYYAEMYDYDQLAATLREEATYFERILHADRFYYSYFRVVYHGNNFDEEIRGKEFIYRGNKLEAVMDFTSRIKKKFPQARIIMSSDAPSAESLEQHPDQISITTLKAEKEESEKVLERKEYEAKMALKLGDKPDASRRAPPFNVAKYRQNNDLIVFSFSKPVLKSKEKKPENEFKYLWVCKTFIYAEESLPTNRRRVQVVDRKEVMFSPVENAIKTIQEKNEELRNSSNQVDNAPTDVPVDVGPLSMCLQGMIDAAVNGGTQKYISAFLNDEYLKENPDPQNAKLQQDLKDVLRDHAEALKQGLSVFGTRSSPELKGLLDHLTGSYNQMTTQFKVVLR